MSKQRSARRWIRGPLAALKLSLRYQRTILGHGPWSFSGAAAASPNLPAWERALMLVANRQRAKGRAGRAPAERRAKLWQVAALLGSPGVLPDAAQRSAVVAAVRDLDRHSEPALSQRAFSPVERAALLELEFALHLAAACPWYGQGRAPILEAPAAGEPLYVVDARCLQHFDYRRRGVGLHTRAVLAALRGMAPPAAKIVLLLDPALDPLDAEAAAQSDRQVYSCAAIDLAKVALLLSASPMTASIGPIMPLLLAPHVRRVAITYDFIPARFPSQYLREAADVIRYQAQIMSLPAYHAFLPISAATGMELRERLGFAGALVAHSGVGDPLEAVSGEVAANGLPQRYIAAPTGDEPRKNLLIVFAAEALNRSLGDDPNRIVVVGRLGPKATEAVRKFCRRIGFPMSDLVIRNEVSAHDLAAAYRHALVCIVPSFTEGFSIPLAEAVHAGIAVVASDIPTHRDLIGAGPWLATPSSVADMARAVRATIKTRHAVLRRQQESLGDKARPDAVRSRVTSLLSQLLAMPADASAPVTRQAGDGRRPHIAVATPWPPQRSGIASYSRHTMARLADLADVTILTNEPPDRLEHGDARISMREISASAYLDPRYDRVLTVLGNSHFHLPALEYLLALGGPALAHDNRMVEFYRHFYGPAETARLLTVPDRATVQVPDIVPLLHDPDRLPALGYADIGRVAQPLLVHSASLQTRLSHETQARVLALPFVPYRAPSVDTTGSGYRQMARQRYGLDEATLHVATFGMLDRRTKGANVLLEAMAWLDLWRVPARLHIVGDVLAPDRTWIEDTARANGTRDRFVFHDYLDEHGYGDMLRAVDVAVQLRVGSVLTLSGALLDCIAFGVPTIATRSMAADTHAPDFVIAVPDKLSPLLVAEAIAAHGHDRAALSHEIETQRAAYLARHSAERYARLMAAALGLNGRTAP